MISVLKYTSKQKFAYLHLLLYNFWRAFKWDQAKLISSKTLGDIFFNNLKIGKTSEVLFIRYYVFSLLYNFWSRFKWD